MKAQEAKDDILQKIRFETTVELNDKGKKVG